MRRLVTAALVTAAVPAPAHAGRYGYAGGCGGVFSINGQDTTGTVWLDVVPTDVTGDPAPWANATAWCEVRVNGVSRGTVLGPAAGTGVVLDAGTTSFLMYETDELQLCDHVVVENEAEIVRCDGVGGTPLIPPPVLDAINDLLRLICAATGHCVPPVDNPAGGVGYDPPPG